MQNSSFLHTAAVLRLPSEEVEMGFNAFVVLVDERVVVAVLQNMAGNDHVRHTPCGRAWPSPTSNCKIYGHFSIKKPSLIRDNSPLSLHFQYKIQKKKVDIYIVICSTATAAPIVRDDVWNRSSVIRLVVLRRAVRDLRVHLVRPSGCGQAAEGVSHRAVAHRLGLDANHLSPTASSSAREPECQKRMCSRTGVQPVSWTSFIVRTQFAYRAVMSKLSSASSAVHWASPIPGPATAIQFTAGLKQSEDANTHIPSSRAADNQSARSRCCRPESAPRTRAPRRGSSLPPWIHRSSRCHAAPHRNA